MEGQHGDDPGRRDRGAGHAQHQPSWPAARQPQPDEQRGRQPPGHRDQRAAPPGRPGRVGQGHHRAGPGGAQGRDQRGDQRHGQRQRGHQADRWTPSATARPAPRPGPRPGWSAAARPATRRPARATAATRARIRFSASRTAATRPGVPPAALSRPTRWVCSAIRPPVSTATVATASSPSSQLPGLQHALLVGHQQAVRVPDGLPGDHERRGGRQPPVLRIGAGQRRSPGRVGQPQVQHVGPAAAGGQRAGAGRGHPGQPGAGSSRASSCSPPQHMLGNGGRAAVTAVPATVNRRAAQGDDVPRPDAERRGQRALQHHRAGPHPGAGGHQRLVDRRPGPGPVLRPARCTAMPCARSRTLAARNGPLCPVTPGAWISGRVSGGTGPDAGCWPPGRPDRTRRADPAPPSPPWSAGKAGW